MSQHPDQIRHRAMSLIKERQFTEALTVLNDLVQISDHPMDVLWRAKMHLAIGSYSHAIEDYQTVIAQTPNERSALHHLALILACCPDDYLRDGNRALSLATRALELTTPSDCQVMSVVAASHAETGNFHDAVGSMRVAIESAPSELRPRFEERLTQYMNNEPYRLSSADTQLQLETDPRLCQNCGESTFMSVPDANGRRLCLCIRCAEYDFGASDPNQSETA